MKTHVQFCSGDFPAYPGESEDINPGRFGKRLPEFLVRGLKEQGHQPLEPVAEDWGWVIPIQNDSFSLWIGCGNDEDTQNGFLCFIEPHRATIRRWFLWKIDTSPQVTALQQAIDRLLSGNSVISNKRWSTYEEFHRTRS